MRHLLVFALLAAIPAAHALGPVWVDRGEAAWEYGSSEPANHGGTGPQPRCMGRADMSVLGPLPAGAEAGTYRLHLETFAKDESCERQALTAYLSRHPGETMTYTHACDESGCTYLSTGHVNGTAHEPLMLVLHHESPDGAARTLLVATFD